MTNRKCSDQHQHIAPVFEQVRQTQRCNKEDMIISFYIGDMPDAFTQE